MGGQLQREWRLAGRNSITLEKQADPAVTNEMAADDRAMLCAGTNTTGIFLSFLFLCFKSLLSRSSTKLEKFHQQIERTSKNGTFLLFNFINLTGNSLIEN